MLLIRRGEKREEMKALVLAVSKSDGCWCLVVRSLILSARCEIVKLYHSTPSASQLRLN